MRSSLEHLRGLCLPPEVVEPLYPGACYPSNVGVSVQNSKKLYATSTCHSFVFYSNKVRVPACGLQAGGLLPHPVVPSRVLPAALLSWSGGNRPLPPRSRKLVWPGGRAKVGVQQHGVCETPSSSTRLLIRTAHYYYNELLASCVKFCQKLLTFFVSVLRKQIVTRAWLHSAIPRKAEQQGLGTGGRDAVASSGCPGR